MQTTRAIAMARAVKAASDVEGMDRKRQINKHRGGADRDPDIGEAAIR
jgi:hypothetical protein